ncbi:NAD(P)H dehydrogenase (quinone) [Paenibacillus sp. NFR01]|nr:NAD(P)H dehydrogenase (quinone) [Paenibacillus sp. NFR01]
MMSIAITGAGGNLGRLIIKQLLKALPPHEIIACVRHPEAAQDLADQGIAVRLCDYDRSDTLQAAFSGISRLLLISSPHPDDSIRLRQHAHVIEAAKQASVGHLLYTSFAFAENGACPLVHLHLATEHAIMAAGLPYTMLRSGLYTDIAGAFDLSAALASGELRVPPGDWRFNSVSRRDLAAAIAAVLADADRYRNQRLELTAPQTWRMADLAAALTGLSGNPITVVTDAAVNNWVFGFLQLIDTASTSDDLERLLSRPPETLLESIRPFVRINPPLL